MPRYTNHITKCKTVSSSQGRNASLQPIIKNRSFGQESSNIPVYNDMIEALSGLCVQRYGANWRAISGRCNGNVREFSCLQTTNTAAGTQPHQAPCQDNEACGTFTAKNFRGGIATFPFCGAKIQVNERHQEGVHTEWDGHFFTQSPKSSGSWNDFVALAGGFNVYFGFTSGGGSTVQRSAGKTWYCTACNWGQLTITSIVRPTYGIYYSSRSH